MPAGARACALLVVTFAVPVVAVVAVAPVGWRLCSRRLVGGNLRSGGFGRSLLLLVVAVAVALAVAARRRGRRALLARTLVLLVSAALGFGLGALLALGEPHGIVLRLRLVAGG